MKPQIKLRQLLTILTLCSATFAAVMLVPAGSLAGQGGPRAEERSARAEERSARAEERAQEKEAARKARTEEREARHDARRSSTTAPGETSGQPGPDTPTTSGRPCKPTIQADSTHVLAGETVTLSGTIGCPTQTEALAQAPAGAAPIAQTVTIYQRHQGLGAAGHGASGLETAGTATIAADGSFTLTSPALATNTVFQVRDGRHTARVLVKVAPQVTLVMSVPNASTSAVSKAPKHPRVAFTGTVDPINPGAFVVLQVSYADGSWRKVAVSRVSSAGTYSFAHTFKASGPASIRTVVHGRRLNVAGISEVLTYAPPQPEGSPQSPPTQQPTTPQPEGPPPTTPQPEGPPPTTPQPEGSQPNPPQPEGMR